MWVVYRYLASVSVVVNINLLSWVFTEAHKQALSTWPTTTPHFPTATTWLSQASRGGVHGEQEQVLSSLFFLPQQGSILLCKYDSRKQRSLGSIHVPQPWWLDLPSSPALCAATRRVLNYSINSPPELAPSAIIKYPIGLKSLESTPQLHVNLVLWYQTNISFCIQVFHTWRVDVHMCI